MAAPACKQPERWQALDVKEADVGHAQRELVACGPPEQRPERGRATRLRRCAVTATISSFRRVMTLHCNGGGAGAGPALQRLGPDILPVYVLEY